MSIIISAFSYSDYCTVEVKYDNKYSICCGPNPNGFPFKILSKALFKLFKQTKLYRDLKIIGNILYPVILTALLLSTFF